jgi:predicted HTH transcriptional regulator
MEYVKNNGSVSNKEARELLSLADSTTKRVLNEMVNYGLLEVKGGNIRKGIIILNKWALKKWNY